MTVKMDTEQATPRSLLRATKVGVDRLGYGSPQAVRQAILEGSFPLPLYKRINSGSSPWLVRSDEVDDFIDNLAPSKVA